MRAAILALALAVVLAGPAAAQTSSGSDLNSQCDLQLVDPSQIVESVAFNNLAYFLNVSYWGADEFNVGDVNTTTCLAIPLPFADFVQSTGLTDLCYPSSSSPPSRNSGSSGNGTSSGTSGRKLKAVVQQPAFLRHPGQVAQALRHRAARVPLSKGGTPASFAKLASHSRSLLQLGLIGSGSGGSNSTNGTSGGSGGGSGRSSNSTSSGSGVAVCSADYQESLSEFTIYPSLLFGDLAAYFIAADSNDDTYGCMALFPEDGGCADFCVDLYDFVQSTGVDFPSLCSAAGLV